MTSQQEEPLTIEARWDIPYRHTAGQAASRFFRELKENKRIMGVRCPECRRVLVPPRSFCERCFVPIEEWVQVGETGILTTFTICYAKFTSLPPPPYCIGLIKPDGADTGLMHYVGGVDLQDLEAAKKALSVGMRVQAVWRDERKGEIADIEYFRPA